MLRKCHRSDPNLNDCIKEAIEDLRPYLARGKSLVFVISNINNIAKMYYYYYSRLDIVYNLIYSISV